MGFLVPNAIDTADIRQSEPDAVDWRILGDRDNAVISGLDLTATGANMSASLSAGIVVIDGTIYEVAADSVTLASGGANDRFDIIGATASGLAVETGTASTEPVFPDIPDTDFVPLWAVLVLSGVSTVEQNKFTDKRTFILDGARGAADETDTFLHNKGADGSQYKVLGDGETVWGTSPDEVTATPTANKLTFDKEVEFNDLTVTGDTVGVDGDFTGVLTSSNWSRGSGEPSGGSAGDVYQRTNGTLYVRGASQWEEVYADEYPVGTVIANVMEPADMAANDPNWQIMDGTRLVNAATPGQVGNRLWDICPASWKDNSDIVLPDMRSTFIQGAATTGVVGNEGGNNSLILSQGQMPRHGHFTSTATASGGAHSHTGTTDTTGSHAHSVSSSGSHSHPVSDPGHRHNGMNPYGNDVPTYFCGAVWGGNNKLDAHFSDASHTWTVDMAISTVKATTGVSIPNSGSHSHGVSTSGTHAHTVSIGNSGGHTHSLPAESQKGNNEPFDNRPKWIGLNYYIKL